MGNNCASLLADLFSYEAEYTEDFIKAGNLDIDKTFNVTMTMSATSIT